MTNHTYTDIEKLLTENEKLRHQIRHMNESKSMWYETLFNNSNEAVAICDEFSGFPSSIINCNDEFASVLKRKSGNLVGLDFMDLLRKGQKKKFFIRTFEAGKTNSIENFALVFLDGENKEQNIEISTQKLKAENKHLIVITLHPLNETKGILHEGIEQVLASSNQLFFNFKNDDILSLNHVSLSAYKVTGFSSQQLQLNPFTFWNNCHPDDIKKIKTFLGSDNNYFFQLNIRFIRKDEQMVWITLCIIRNPGKEGNETDYYAIGQEVTSLQRKKRLASKRELYHRLILQSTKSLFTEESDMALKYIGKILLKPLKADRVAIHILPKDDLLISLNTFKADVTLEEKLFLPSNEAIWTKYEEVFTMIPVITYQSINDGYLLDREEPHFFAHKNQKSVLLIPIRKEGTVIGFISTATIKNSITWDRADINFISEIADLIGIAN